MTFVDEGFLSQALSQNRLRDLVLVFKGVILVSMVQGDMSSCAGHQGGQQGCQEGWSV